MYVGVTCYLNMKRDARFGRETNVPACWGLVSEGSSMLDPELMLTLSPAGFVGVCQWIVLFLLPSNPGTTGGRMSLLPRRSVCVDDTCSDVDLCRSFLRSVFFDLMFRQDYEKMKRTDDLVPFLINGWLKSCSADDLLAGSLSKHLESKNERNLKNHFYFFESYFVKKS